MSLLALGDALFGDPDDLVDELVSLIEPTPTTYDEEQPQPPPSIDSRVSLLALHDAAEKQKQDAEQRATEELNQALRQQARRLPRDTKRSVGRTSVLRLGT